MCYEDVIYYKKCEHAYMQMMPCKAVEERAAGKQSDRLLLNKVLTSPLYYCDLNPKNRKAEYLAEICDDCKDLGPEHVEILEKKWLFAQETEQIHVEGMSREEQAKKMARGQVRDLEAGHHMQRGRHSIQNYKNTYFDKSRKYTAPPNSLTIKELKFLFRCSSCTEKDLHPGGIERNPFDGLCCPQGQAEWQAIQRRRGIAFEKLPQVVQQSPTLDKPVSPTINHSEEVIQHPESQTMFRYETRPEWQLRAWSTLARGPDDPPNYQYPYEGEDGYLVLQNPEFPSDPTCLFPTRDQQPKEPSFQGQEVEANSLGQKDYPRMSTPERKNLLEKIPYKSSTESNWEETNELSPITENYTQKTVTRGHAILVEPLSRVKSVSGSFCLSSEQSDEEVSSVSPA